MHLHVNGCASRRITSTQSAMPESADSMYHGARLATVASALQCIKKIPHDIEHSIGSVHNGIKLKRKGTRKTRPENEEKKDMM